MTDSSHRRPLTPADERMWATLIHVGGIVLSVVPSLVGYIVFKERSGFLAEHTRNALNFQITMLIAQAVAWVLGIIGIGLLLAPLVIVLTIVFSVIAAVAANKGELYRYPLSLQLVK